MGVYSPSGEFSTSQQADHDRLRYQDIETATENKIKAQLKEQKDAEELAVQKWQTAREEEEKRKKTAAEDAVLKYKLEQQRNKEERDRMKIELQSEAEKKKQEAEANKKKWEVEQQKEKKEKEDAVEEEMRKRLSKIGFAGDRLEDMVDPKKQTIRRFQHPSLYSRPVYLTIKRDKVELASLEYYGLPWRYDAVSFLEQSTSRTL